ncbi:unnamed protein product [Polarella glacialis]|uniref:Uncharacterized protein n=1 Tax=Polarella glacialis TaxID=89957 RepID=A0A813E5V2_POLGL|nr:unnamed protein product [Polarella glacialis]
MRTLALLESLVGQGKWDVQDYSARLAEKFGKSSLYEQDACDPDKWPDLKEHPKDSEGKVIEEQRKWTMPLPGPWRHGSIKGFLKNYVNQGKRFPDCGSDDAQVDGCCKVAPLVALLAGRSEMLQTVDQAVRVTQNTDAAAGYACGFARLLEKLVLGSAGSLVEALPLVGKELLDPARAFQSPMDAEVAANLGRVLGELEGLSPAEAGLKLKPEASSFAAAGLA